MLLWHIYYHMLSSCRARSGCSRYSLCGQLQLSEPSRRLRAPGRQNRARREERSGRRSHLLITDVHMIMNVRMYRWKSGSVCIYTVCMYVSLISVCMYVCICIESDYEPVVYRHRIYVHLLEGGTVRPGDGQGHREGGPDSRAARAIGNEQAVQEQSGQRCPFPLAHIHLHYSYIHNVTVCSFVVQESYLRDTWIHKFIYIHEYRYKYYRQPELDLTLE